MRTAAPARTEVLTFRFSGRTNAFEGQIAGALERAESGGAVVIAGGVFVGRDDESGELMVLESIRGAGPLVAALADFRLAASRRRALTERTLAESPHAPLLRRIGESLAPGAAVVVAVVEHAWLSALNDAVARSGGRTAADDVGAGAAEAEDPVEAALIAALAPVPS
jgi:hypothetical protein